MRKVWVLFLLLGVLMLFGIELYPPVDNPRITSTFGEYRPLGIRGPHFHMGVDFSTARRIGVDIKAAADGYLVRVVIDDDDIYGYTVVLQHEGGYRTVYAHLSDFSPKIKELVQDILSTYKGKRVVVRFTPGDVVFKKGDVVGKSGSTGEAMKPHCHFEVRNEDETVSYDPMLFLVGVPRPIDEKVILEQMIIDGSPTVYVEGGEYYYEGDYPKIEILGFSVGNGNRLGLKDIKMYMNSELIYEISFDQIEWTDFGNVSYVYNGKRSYMTVEDYVAWYRLYPVDLHSQIPIIKVNKFPQIKRFPYRAEIRLELYDAWGLKRTFRFYVRRR